MAQESDNGQEVEREADLAERLEEIGKTTVKVAASAVVATSLVGALSEPPNTDLMSLPEPTPIVQVYQAFDDDPVTDEDEDDESQSRWRRILKALRYLLIALALVGSILLGVLKGCAGLLAAPLLPHEEEKQEQTTQQTQTEDERGVAVAG